MNLLRKTAFEISDFFLAWNEKVKSMVIADLSNKRASGWRLKSIGR